MVETFTWNITFYFGRIKLEVRVTKLTDVGLLRKACEFTIAGKSNVSLDTMYRCEHSPIRTQLFWVEMYDIPTFVSVHMVRHSVGITHYVKSNREDRIGYTGDTGRNHPVNHSMLLNAEALINMARKRLCSTAHVETRAVMQEIVKGVSQVDEALSHYLVPNCLYRGFCPEIKSCGYLEGRNNTWT